MKKIVGIIAAVAMAASVFAVDITGGLKVNGSLFDIEFTDNAKPSALTVNLDNGGFYWGSRLQTAFYGDKCGAQLALSWHGWEAAEAAHGGPDFGLHDYKVWVQPVDMLKITFLNVEDKLNDPFFDGEERTYKVDGSWQFELKPIDAITATLTLGSPYVNKGKIGTTAFSFKYAADFGTIGLLYSGDNTFNDGWIGAAFAGTFDPISMFVQAYFGYGANLGLRADAEVVANIDAMKIGVYAALWDKGLKFNDFSSSVVALANANDRINFGFRFEYALDSATPYLEIRDTNLLSSTFDMSFKPGVKFNIGAAACDIGVKIAINDANVTKDASNNVTGVSSYTTKITVPFEVTVGF